MTLPSPEEQHKIDALAQEVMKELRRVTVRNFWIETTRTVVVGVLLGLYVWWIS